ncbi:SMP-30/gluconolactonase/LRE family protein [Aureliella helgolandensis]|uniref:Gluconolactonase n=1 Tax=Aureliella helgolandensis TaxID=2527968 RepID=A0A518GE39_9BACT|nr:SMP-30/gluconolactonase/LRE family protein [Aureliella helgolandensis]QDV26865.1 Gluconolactonase precursor [Aureliella helgolandensis]
MKAYHPWRLPNLILVLSSLLFVQDSVVAQQYLGTVERLSPELDSLLEQDAKMEILGSGFTWTEGPVWMGGAEGHLLFSDIPRNSIFQWSQDSGIRLFMSPSGYTGVTYYGLEPGSNGLLKDLQGRLVMCEHGDRRISVLTEQGGKRTLTDNYQGKRFNSPNDAILKRNGDLYFTDPPYGLPERFTDPHREIDFCGVYRLSPDGTVTLLTKEIERPNGLAFSPDESTLYVAQSHPEHATWTSFPVQADGTLGKGHEFYDATHRVGAELGLPDGMTVDGAGNLWASGPGGIYIFSSEAKLLGRLLTGLATSNCTFGPEGWLYVTADSHVVRIKTKAVMLPATP